MVLHMVHNAYTSISQGVHAMPVFLKQWYPKHPASGHVGSTMKNTRGGHATGLLPRASGPT